MKPRDLLFSGGTLIGLAVGFAIYYLNHKTFGWEALAQTLSVLADLGVALWLTTLAGGIGLWLLAKLRLLPSPPVQIGLSSTLGFGALGLGTLLLGLLGLIKFELTVGLLLVLTLLMWRDMRQWAQAAAQSLLQLGQGGAFNRFCAGLVGLTLALGLIQSLAPPLRWDALTYHLTLPKWYAELGHLRVDANFIFTGMPQLNEMVFTLTLILRNEQAAQALGWCFGVVLTLSLVRFSVDALNLQPPALAPAILFSAYTIAVSLAWAYAEMLMMLGTVALLISLREWTLTLSWRWLLVAGVCAGLVMGGKYTGLIVPLGAVGFLGGVCFFTSAGELGQKVNAFFRAAIVFGFATLLTFLPWLLKNLWLTGNPVYPLVFPTATMEAERLWFYNRPDRINHDLVTALTIFPRAVFLGAQSQNEYDATLGPIWGVWPCLLILGWRRLGWDLRRWLVPLIAFCGLAYAGWVILMFISQYAIQARLFFALFPVLALLAVAGQMVLQKLDTPQLRISFIAQTALSVALVLALVETTLTAVRLNPLPYFLGLQSASAYREQQLGGYEIVTQDINALPANARVQFLWETWGLNCDRYTRCVPDMIIDGWFTARRRFGAAENILAAWHQQGITHVLIFETGLGFVKNDQNFNVYTLEDWQALADLRNQLALIKNYGDVYSLYAIP
jgi:hypothetical protein